MRLVRRFHKGLHMQPGNHYPLLDRIDIHVDVPRVAYEKITDQRLGQQFSSSSACRPSC